MLFKKKNFNLFGLNIIINIDRSIKLKSLSIKISKDCISVIAPFFISNNKIDKLLNKKFNWIKKQLFIQNNIHPLIEKKYVNGEEFKYLGKTFKLQIIIGVKYSIKIEDNFLIVIVKNTKNKNKIKKLIHNWFYKNSISYFKEKTLLHAEVNNLKFLSVKVREYKARWGSCSINGDITFNWRLIMAPPRIIEYVIIHELVHLIEHNHSPKYWEHVKEIYPNANEAKNWLIFNGKTLNI